VTIDPAGARPSSALRATAALARLELRLTARRGENVLVTLVIPVAVLLFFSGTSVIPLATEDPVGFLLPGSMALAIVAAGLVNLGIATGYDRAYGVLKRLGGSPLPHWGLLAAKVAAVAVLEVVQVALLVVVAMAGFGWQPGPAWSPLLLVLGLGLGTFTFVALGLLLAGTLRAEATLALANALFLGLLMLGGIVLPVDHLPEILAPLARVLPSTVLADVLRVALDTGIEHAASTSVPWNLGVLGSWGVAAGLASVRWFRWA